MESHKCTTKTDGHSLNLFETKQPIIGDTLFLNETLRGILIISNNLGLDKETIASIF